MYNIEFSDGHYLLIHTMEGGTYGHNIAEIYGKADAEYILSLLQPVYNENGSEISKMY